MSLLDSESVKQQSNFCSGCEYFFLAISISTEDGGTENFYKFPLIKETATIKELQPLQGLNPDIVSKVFKDKFNVSDNFLNALIKKAEVV